MMNRRSVLKRAIYWIICLFGSLVAGASFSLYPFGLPRKTTRYLPVLPLEEAPRKGVKTVLIPFTVGDKRYERRAFLVATDGSLMALSSQCTHLGCLVNWDANRKEFLCPCHGGRYDVLGRPISGPPPAPLAVLPLKVEGDMIHVGVRI